MKVLITNTGPWGTGSGTVADGVMKELRRRGHEVMAFFPDTGFPGAEYQRYYGDKESYRIVRFPVTHNGIHLYTFPLIIPDPNPRNYDDAWTYRDLSQLELSACMDYMNRELENVIEDFKPDVIECQHIWAIDHLVKNMGYHYACVAHHSDQMGFLFDERMQKIAIQSAIKADYIFAISRYVKDEVLRYYAVQPERVIVTENGYDQSVFKPVENPERQKVLSEMGYRDLKDYPTITFCGKISRTKGIDTLLEANKLIQEKMKVYILIAGSGSLDNFDQQERDRFHMENVICLGQQRQEDLARLHSISVLSVLPSRSEGFGIAAMEAMGCGIPVVVTDVGGLPSFARGKIVSKENPKDLACAILELLCMDGKEYRKLCQEAYLTAKQYTWENIVDIRMKYYEEISWLNANKEF
jgi:glycosyltransferase involved in cell wall biosynthesis